MEDLLRVQRLVAYCTKKYGTSDPFEIADQLGILYQIGNCEHEGCYMFLKNHRYIFLSNRLDRTELNLVMAHELGHALLDRKANCYFIRNQTLLLTSKFEIEANTFAAELLIPDELISDNPGLTSDQVARLAGYNAAIMKFKKP